MKDYLLIAAPFSSRRVSAAKKDIGARTSMLAFLIVSVLFASCKKEVKNSPSVDKEMVANPSSGVSLLAAGDPGIASITQGAWTKIAQASGDTWMHFPRAISYDVLSGSNIVKKALVNWQTNADVVQFPMTHGWMGSVGAVTWNSPSPTTTPEVDMMGCVRRNTDGVMIAIPFYLGYTGANPTPPFIFSYQTSANNGTTWVNQPNAGTVTGFPAGQQLAGFRFHRGIIQDADGTLYAPAHAQWRVGGVYEGFRVMLMKSTDGGATWNYVSTIAYTAGLTYSEATIVRCKDGSILAVMRNATGSTLNSLKSRRTTDNGLTWGSIVYLSGVPTNQGVDPELQLMPNGVLVLSYGNNVTGNMRHCLLAFSEDGNGTSWSNITQTFTSSTSGLGNKSTGYTATFPMTANRLIQVSDRGLYNYYGSAHHPTPNPFSIWSKTIDINLGYSNAIDLKGQHASGNITVSTDMTYSNTTHPQARISGAFDESTAYWSGAFKMAGSGYYTIDLRRNMTIHALGVCLVYGRSQSATIEYSQNGTTWTTIKSYTNATHYALDYTDLTPVSARYIRVTSSSTSGIVGLNELQLFTTADTFEDYTAGVPPTGYTVLNGGFWVSNGVTPLPTGYYSSQALYMQDEDSLNKEISKTGFTASATKTFEFMLRTKGFASGGGVQFRLMSGTTSVFRMAVAPSGSVRYYNGSWVILPGTPVSLDTWKAIKVVANASANTAAIYVDGVLIGTATKETASATTMNGFLFGSSGSAPIGDKALFDDVSLY